MRNGRRFSTGSAIPKAMLEGKGDGNCEVINCGKEVATFARFTNDVERCVNILQRS